MDDAIMLMFYVISDCIINYIQSFSNWMLSAPRNSANIVALHKYSERPTETANIVGIRLATVGCILEKPVMPYNVMRAKGIEISSSTV